MDLLDKMLNSHILEWKQMSALDPQKNLSLLNLQLSQYCDLVDSKEEKCLPSTGSPRPRVLLLTLQPGLYETEPFSRCDWLRSFIELLGEYVPEEDIHFMNLFPYFLGNDEIDKMDKTSPEIKVFMQFAKKRIEILNPKLIISFGNKTDRNLNLYLNEKKFGDKRTVAIEPLKVNNKQFNYLNWLHPFNFQQNKNEHFFQEKWESAIKCAFDFFEKERAQMAKRRDFFKKRIAKATPPKKLALKKKKTPKRSLGKSQKSLTMFGFVAKI